VITAIKGPLLALGLTYVGGCRDAVGPESREPFALVATSTGSWVLGLESGRLLGDSLSSWDRRVLSSDSSLLVWSYGQLVAFDVTARTVIWVQPGGRQPSFGGQVVWGQWALALSADRSTLIAADAEYSGRVGLSVLDLTSRTAVGFIHQLRTRYMFTLQPGPVLQTDGFLVLGTRVPKTYDHLEIPERSGGKLFLLAPVTSHPDGHTYGPLGIVDSIKFLSAADSAAGGVATMLLSRDGRHLYFTTYTGRLHRYDLVERKYAATVQVPTFGPLAQSPGGGMIYMIDGFNDIFHRPGSGFMYAAPGDLSSVEPIDLRAAHDSDVPPKLNTLAVSPDGRTVYVGMGTPPRGPLYGVQPGAIIALNAETHQIRKVTVLPTWGVSDIILLPR
jgi:hypothetical protein